MSDINSPPEGSEPNSSPAFPHLQACIEAVVRDAVQSGIPEEFVRQLLRRHEIQFGEILATLNSAYDIRPTEKTTNAPTTDQPQSNLSPAVQTAANQPFIDPGELLEDEDVPPPTPTPAVPRIVHRPSALPPSPMKHLITNATNTIRPAEERGFQPLETPAVEDRNQRSRQDPFVDSPSRPERETFLSKTSAFAADVAGLSLDAVDRGQAMNDHRRRKVRDWDDGQASSSRVMVDPNLPAAGDPSVAEPDEPGPEEAESLLDELAERKMLESPEGDRLAALANNPAELRASIRRASEARAREQVDDRRSVAGSEEAGSLTGSQTEMEGEEHGVEESERTTGLWSQQGWRANGGE